MTTIDGEQRQPSLEGARLFSELQQSGRELETAADRCRAAATSTAQQRGHLDAMTEHARRSERRLQDSVVTLEQISEAFERIKLVALNTGLEGARLGESTGCALVAVADEVRGLASRGLELLADQLTQGETLSREQQTFAETVELTRENTLRAANDLRDAQAAQQRSLQALERLRLGLEQSTGLDAESARRVAQATEHASALVASLEELAAPRRRALAREALLPALEPLLRLLLDDLSTPSQGS